MFFLLCFAIAKNATCGVHFGEVDEKIINIEWCIFADLSFLTNGGAVLINSQSSYAIIKFDSFDNCSALGYSSKGGTIFCNCYTLNLSSICCSRCSAEEGSFLYSDIIVYNFISLSSLSTSRCDHGNTICIHQEKCRLTYFNNSKAEEIDCIISLDSSPYFVSAFSTLSNSSDSKCLFILIGCQDFAIDLSNIVGNRCNGFEYFCGSSISTTLNSCVFVENEFNALIISSDSHKNYSVSIKDCWIDESRESVISKEAGCFCSLDFGLCNFTSTKTLGFIDLKLITDGVSCGIRLPSPSKTPFQTPSGNSIPKWGIILIVIGLTIFCAAGGGLIWYYTRKIVRRSVQPDVEAISLLRNLENSYG